MVATARQYEDAENSTSPKNHHPSVLSISAHLVRRCCKPDKGKDFFLFFFLNCSSTILFPLYLFWDDVFKVTSIQCHLTNMQTFSGRTGQSKGERLVWDREEEFFMAELPRARAEIVWGEVWQPLTRTWMLAPCVETTLPAKNSQSISRNRQGWVGEHRQPWAGYREAGNLSAPTAPFHEESSPLPPVSGGDRDKAHPDLHSLLRGEVPTHAHLPTRTIHLRQGGQRVPALLLSGSPARLT